MRESFVRPALGKQRRRNAILGQVVSLRDFEGVGPKREIVSPETHLPMKRNPQRQQNGRSGNG